MSLETFLDPNVPEFGLQKLAWNYVENHPELKRQYKSDPTLFVKRFYGVLDNIVDQYSIKGNNPISISEDLAQLALGSKTGERILGNLENKITKSKLPIKGAGAIGLILALPNVISNYSSIKRETGDSTLARYTALGELFSGVVPFGGELLHGISKGAEYMGIHTPIENHINNIFEQKLKEEFKLDSMDYKQKVANDNYKPKKEVSVRTIGTPKGVNLQ